jgi:hypothetical protein
MRVDKDLERAEIRDWGRISDVFIPALVAMWADTADPEIVKTRASVGGGENGELIGTEGVQVEGEEASVRAWAGGGGGGCSIAVARRSAGGGGVGSRSSINRGFRGGSEGGAAGFAAGTGGIRSFVVRFAGLIVADSQVVEVVLPTAKEGFHIFQDVLDVAGRDRCVVLCGGDGGLGLTEVVEAAEHIVKFVL